jgi:hypothetical protein
MIQRMFVFSPDRSDERRDFRCSQSLLSDEDNRRTSRRSQREDLREVSVKRDNHPRFAGCVVKDLGV